MAYKNALFQYFVIIIKTYILRIYFLIFDEV